MKGRRALSCVVLGLLLLLSSAQVAKENPVVLDVTGTLSAYGGTSAVSA